MSDITISEPISEELRSLDEWKKCTITQERGDHNVTYVTLDFHNAMLAEFRARWNRDIARLEAIQKALE